MHPTAVVDAAAQIDPTAEIGPFCVVGPHVRLGAHTRLVAHVVVQGRTRLGAHNVVHPFASLGGPPQDLKYRGEPSELHVGDANVVREGVTINLGTEAGGMRTELGSRCLLMAYAHVAHDCRLGDGVILANGVGLAGHVHIDDDAIVGGLAAVHQHCRVGRLAFVGGGSMVAQDVLPFCIAQGDRATLGGLNVVGLRRRGLGKPTLVALRAALQCLFAPGRAREDSLRWLEQKLAPDCAEVAELARFARAASRGICALRGGHAAAERETRGAGAPGAANATDAAVRPSRPRPTTVRPPVSQANA